MFELDEIMRQKDDKHFAEILNRLRVGKHTTKDIAELKKKCTISQKDAMKMTDVPHFFPTNEKINAYNNEQLHKSPEHAVKVTAIDAPVENVSDSARKGILEAAKHKDKVSSTGNLPYELVLKVGQQYDITANIEPDDGIMNGTECCVRFIQRYDRNPAFPAYVWVTFTDKAVGSHTRQKNAHLRTNQVGYLWTPIFAIKRNFVVKKTQYVTRIQFPLRLAAARSIHVAQSATFPEIVIDMSTTKKPCAHFWAHMHYVALSRCTSLAGLHIVDFNEDKIYTSQDVKNYLAQKLPMQLSFQPTYAVPDDWNIAYNNVHSLRQKFDTVIKSYNIIGADIIALAETWLSTNDHSSKFDLEHFTQVRMDSSLQKPPRRGMLVLIRETVKVLRIDKVQNTNIECVYCKIEKKHSVIQLLLLYKPPQTKLTALKQELHKLSALLDMTLPLFLIGDFNIDVSGGKNGDFLDYMKRTYHVTQCVSDPTTWAATTIDLVFSNVPNITTYVAVNMWSDHHTLFVQSKI
jgi:hypothetical protein